jgi:hypothetical protein
VVCPDAVERNRSQPDTRGRRHRAAPILADKMVPECYVCCTHGHSRTVHSGLLSRGFGVHHMVVLGSACRAAAHDRPDDRTTKQTTPTAATVGPGPCPDTNLSRPIDAHRIRTRHHGGEVSGPMRPILPVVVRSRGDDHCPLSTRCLTRSATGHSMRSYGMGFRSGNLTVPLAALYGASSWPKASSAAGIG